ncbi:unnamed protein product [Auanema sp. JU1783]|nr:unnamed protein product [Auanema sp. JU1783]
MSKVLIVFLLCMILSVYGQWFFSPFNFNFQQPTTAAPSPPSYVDHYKRHGYDTDDKGNVWLGNDHAKLLLIARSSYP